MTRGDGEDAAGERRDNIDIPPDSTTAQRLKKDLAHVDLVIVDEISMVAPSVDIKNVNSPSFFATPNFLRRLAPQVQ